MTYTLGTTNIPHTCIQCKMTYKKPKTFTDQAGNEKWYCENCHTWWDWSEESRLKMLEEGE